MNEDEREMAAALWLLGGLVVFVVCMIVVIVTLCVL